MASIYNIQSWVWDSGNKQYYKNDIVLASDSKYYYALADNGKTGEPNWNPAIVSYRQYGVWGGCTNHNGSDKPHFFWKPSYSANINKRPRVKSIRFGDGYEQIIADGINNNLNVIDITF